MPKIKISQMQNRMFYVGVGGIGQGSSWADITSATITIDLTNFTGTWYAYINASAMFSNTGAYPTDVALRVKVDAGASYSKEGHGSIQKAVAGTNANGGAALNDRVALAGGSSHTLQLQGYMEQSNGGANSQVAMIVTLNNL